MAPFDFGALRAPTLRVNGYLGVFANHDRPFSSAARPAGAIRRAARRRAHIPPPRAARGASARRGRARRAPRRAPRPRRRRRERSGSAGARHLAPDPLGVHGHLERRPPGVEPTEPAPEREGREHPEEHEREREGPRPGALRPERRGPDPDDRERPPRRSTGGAGGAYARRRSGGRRRGTGSALGIPWGDDCRPGGATGPRDGARGPPPPPRPHVPPRRRARAGAARGARRWAPAHTAARATTSASFTHSVASRFEVIGGVRRTGLRSWGLLLEVR